MRRFLLLTCMMILLARPAVADDFADGMAAFKANDFPKAMSLLRPLADGGNTAAQHQVGFMFYWGKGIKKDDQIAMKYFQSAAEKGAIADELTLAMFYEHDGDNAKELKMEGTFGSAARTYAEARKWFDKAMSQGSVEAVRRIGDMYREGRGVEQEYKQAAAWYAKAADSGDAEAQYQLGLLYKKGLGTPPNNVKALLYLNLSAMTDKKEVVDQRDFLARNMSADDVKQAQQLTKDWKVTPLDPTKPPEPLMAPTPAPVAPPIDASPPPSPAGPPSDDPNNAPAP